MPVPLLRQLLYRLALEHVIAYVPQDRADVIYLLHDRLEPGNVALSPRRYKQLQESSHRRSGAMLDYVGQTELCRSRFLLAYFGQTESEDCGTCDVCRAHSTGESGMEALLKALIAERGGRYTLAELRALLDPPSGAASRTWPEVLRRLIEDGAVPPYSPE